MFPTLEDSCGCLPNLVLATSSGLESSEVRLFLFLPAGAGEVERDRDLFLVPPIPVGFNFLGFCSFCLLVPSALLPALPPFLLLLLL